MTCEHCAKPITGHPHGGYIPRVQRRVWFCSRECHARWDLERRP